MNTTYCRTSITQIDEGRKKLRENSRLSVRKTFQIIVLVLLDNKKLIVTSSH